VEVGARTAVLLDNYPLWLEAVSRVLTRIRVRVVGKTIDSEEALELVERHRPDVLVAEIELLGSRMDGLTCLRRACDLVPHLKGIVLSGYSDSEHIDTALNAGAAAYVVKTAHPDDLAAAIRQAFEHSIYFAGLSVPAPAPELVSYESAGLTRRELEILQLVAEGHSNAQLAKMLWVTEQTVKFHLSNIYRKLDVSNRTEASRWAQVHGVLPGTASSAGAA
jgi:DNA-binding NarL/FixJ family response regulator